MPARDVIPEFHNEAIALAKILSGRIVEEPDTSWVRALEEALMSAYEAGLARTYD